MKRTDQLTGHDFQGLIGAGFKLNNKPVTLESVTMGEAPAPKLRAPASLLFVCDEEIDVEHGTQLLSHPDLGDHLLHVHRVNSDEKRTYEIVLA